MSGHVSANGAILEASTIFFARPSRSPRLQARASAPLIIEHGRAANVNRFARRFMGRSQLSVLSILISHPHLIHLLRH